MGVGAAIVGGAVVSGVAGSVSASKAANPNPNIPLTPNCVPKTVRKPQETTNTIKGIAVSICCTS